MSVVEPIDYALEVDTKGSAYCSKAHPFQAKLDSLCFEGGIVAHWFLVRSEITLAILASHTLTTCVISACFYYSF